MARQSTESLGRSFMTWTPGSLRSDVWAGKNLPFWFMPVQTTAVVGALFFSAWGAAATYSHLLKPMNLSPGIVWGGLVFALLFAPPIVLVHWLGQLLVNRNVLALHEKGVRWANSRVLFDRIDSLSMGTETFNEKHLPTLNALWKAHWRHGEAVKKSEELERASTLAFHLKDGSVEQWRNFGRCFSPETLEAFFLNLGERIEGEAAGRERGPREFPSERRYNSHLPGGAE